ncbi:MAG: hypothetical protein Q7S83_03475 [bacterium]|nr:hypothetical protein [bacterium]
MIINASDQKHSLLHYFFKGEALKRFFDTLATGIGLINSYFIISTLSVFHFGLYQLVLSFIAILDGFSLDVMDGVVVVDMRSYLNKGLRGAAKKLYLAYIKLKLGISIMMAVGAFFLSGIIAKSYSEDIGLLIKIASLLLIFRSLQSLESLILKVIMNFTYWSYPAVREVAKLGLIIFLLVTSGSFSIVQLLTAHVIADGVAVLFLTLVLFWRNFYKVFHGVVSDAENHLWGVIKTYGHWTVLRYVFSKISKNVTPWFLKFFINTEAVAFYSLAINLIAFIENLFPLDGLSPILALKSDNRGEISFIFKRAVKYAFWLGMILMVVSFIFVPPVVTFIFPKYQPAMPIFKVMILALPIFGFYKILKATLTVLKEQRVLTMRLLNESLMVPLGLTIFLPIFKLAGAGAAYAMAYVERVWFFYSQLIKKYPEFRIKIRQFFKIDEYDREIFRRTIRRPLQAIKELRKNK